MPDSNGQTTLPLAPGPAYRRTDQLALADLIAWMKANRDEVVKLKNTELFARVHAELPGEQIIDSTIVAIRRRLNMNYTPPTPVEPPKPVDPSIRVLADALIGLMAFQGLNPKPDLLALGTPL